MTSPGETSGNSDPLFLRAMERYGGREAVGSTLWLEGVETVSFRGETGELQVLTPADLANDEKVEATHRWPMTHIGRADPEDLALVTKEAWMRRAILPAIPLRITGDTTRPPLKLDADLKVFRVPRELARYAGVVSETITEINDGEEQPVNRDQSLAFSLRFVPTQGRVASFGLYPSYTGEDYGITAVEADKDVIKFGIGYQKYVELYREPQEGELPPLVAPHQF